MHRLEVGRVCFQDAVGEGKSYEACVSGMLETGSHAPPPVRVCIKGSLLLGQLPRSTLYCFSCYNEGKVSVCFELLKHLPHVNSV